MPVGGGGLWELVASVLGTPPAWASIPERMFMMALAGTGVVMTIRAVLSMIEQVGK